MAELKDIVYGYDGFYWCKLNKVFCSVVTSHPDDGAHLIIEEQEKFDDGSFDCTDKIHYSEACHLEKRDENTDVHRVCVIAKKVIDEAIMTTNKARILAGIPVMTGFDPAKECADKIEQSRVKLKSFVGYDEGEKIRVAIHNYAMCNYKPIYADKYLEFMNDNECTFDINGFQSTNHPYYFTLFTVVSQHVMGDCIEECLDNAIKINEEITNEN